MSTDKIPQLKALWQQAFGDPDAFVDRFFGNFFSPNRCRYLEEDGKIVSADDTQITTTCIRVPVTDGHTAAVFVSFDKKVSCDEIIERWKNYNCW